MNDPDASIKHFAIMQTLASDLAKRHIAIYEHQFDMLIFSSFTAVVGTRHKRWQFIWDGKESVMTVMVATVSDSRGVPEWRTLVSDHPQNSPYNYIDDYDYETA